MAKLIIESGCGILVEPEDGKAMYMAVKQLVNNPSERLERGIASRNLALVWDRKRQVEKLIYLFDNLHANSDNEVS